MLLVGYVFKLNRRIKNRHLNSGLVGAFTSSGTRGGAVGGRLYFSENKYQTTFVIAKGRVDVDFFGIGRIPGKEAIKVPIRGGGTVFFGEFLRNVWKDIFVGPRYQHRKIYTRLDGPQPPGGFGFPIDYSRTTVRLAFTFSETNEIARSIRRKGSLFDATGDFDESLGSKRAISKLTKSNITFTRSR